MGPASSRVVYGLAGILAAGMTLSSPTATRAQWETVAGLPEEAVRQIAAVMAEKAQRTPAQQKVSSRLLHEQRLRVGAAARLTWRPTAR